MEYGVSSCSYRGLHQRQVHGGVLNSQVKGLEMVYKSCKFCSSTVLKCLKHRLLRKWQADSGWVAGLHPSMPLSCLQF